MLDKIYHVLEGEGNHHAEDSQGSHPGCWLWHAFFSGDEGDAEGDAADCGQATIQYIVEEALASGIEEILIISGHAKRAIEDHFDSAPALEMELEKKGKTELLQMVRDIGAIKIHYIRQQQMRGLGDAILCARAFVQDEPFAVLLGDDVVYNGEGRPALQQLIDVYNATGSAVLGCQTVPEDKVYVIQ